MENCFTVKGKIVFDPEDFTSKQKRHSEWKKVALIMLEKPSETNGKGLSDYYAWFIKKRFNLILQRPLRGSHVTLISDRTSDMNGKWEEVKNKWDGKTIDITLHIDPFLGIKTRRGNFVDWWLTVPYEYREEIGSIREELGLNKKPYFGFHMTIGTAKNFYVDIEKGVNAKKAMGMYEEHSEMLLNMAKLDMLNLGEIPEYKKNKNE